MTAGKKKSKNTGVIEAAKTPDKLPLKLAVFVGIVTMSVYLLTLAPGVSWEHHSEDSGDLVTAAWVMGIPHPTGYPLFCMLGWLWSHLLAVGSVAWRMNAFSALWGALAAAMMVRAVWSSFGLARDEILSRATRFGRGLASCSAAFIMAFSTDVWAQSVITEVYSLNLFFTALISWILIEILLLGKRSTACLDGERGKIKSEMTRLVSILGLCWGLALTNHMTSLFLMPGIAVVLFLGHIKPSVKDLLKGAMWFGAALLVYLYLPIRSAMNPPLDWGNPESWGNFVWVVSGQQFRRLMFSMMPYQMLNQLMKYNSIPLELGTAGALASVLGVSGLLLSRSRGRALLLTQTLLLVASSLFYLVSYFIWDPEGYLLPMIFAVSLWAGWVIVLMVNVPANMVKAGRFAAILLLIVAPVGALVGHWKDVDLSGDYQAMRYGVESFKAFEPNAVVMEIRYERAFTLWYYREVEYVNTRDDVNVVYIEHATFKWGLDLLKRKYPGLVLPDEPITGNQKYDETAMWIIKNNIGEKPIYIGKIVEELEEEGYRFDAVGLMYRVYPPE